MNQRAKLFFKNISYTVLSNLLILSVSVFLNLFIPKFIGVKEYSYWQLYIFYSGYIYLFHLGWVDGIYLQIGGEEYDDLDKSNLSTQFYYLCIFELLITLVLCILTFEFIKDVNKIFVWISIIGIIIPVILKSFILFVFQASGRIKDYAALSVQDRYLYLLFIGIYLLLGGRRANVLIILDVISKVIITLWSIYIGRDIVFSKRVSFSKVKSNIISNINSGSKLLMGSMISLLIVGIPRFLVERNWSIETFGKLSFALSISNMFVLFMNSISVVLYPMLRKTSKEKLPQLYVDSRNLFLIFSLGLLLLYYPLKKTLIWWLPEYSESIFYMGLLFPIIVYEGRSALLINTYLKTIREERIILIANIFSLVISLMLSVLTVFLTQNIVLIVIIIVISLGVKCIVSEIMLAKLLNIEVIRKNLVELQVVAIFIILNISVTTTMSASIYLFLLLVYGFININKLKASCKYFIKQIKDNNL